MPGVTVARPTNYARSVFHCGSAAVGLFTVAFLPSHTGILVIAVAFATYAWSMELGRRIWPGLNDWLMRAYARVSHPHERYMVNSATWYATGRKPRHATCPPARGGSWSPRRSSISPISSR